MANSQEFNNGVRYLGIDLSVTGTTQLYPLGLEVQEIALDGTGVQTWVYVFNDDGSKAFEAGDVVIADPSASTYDYFGVEVADITTPTTAVLVRGVAQHAIAQAAYGWVLKSGVGTLKIGTANISADVALTTGGSRTGSVIDFAGGVEECIIAHSIAAETTDDTTITAVIRIP